MSLYSLHGIFSDVQLSPRHRYVDQHYLRDAYGDPSKKFPRWVNNHQLSQHLKMKNKDLVPFLKKLDLYPQLPISITNKNLDEKKIEELKSLVPENPKLFHFRISPKNFLDLNRNLQYRDAKDTLGYRDAKQTTHGLAPLVEPKKEKPIAILLEWQRTMILELIFEKTGMEFASPTEIHQKNIEKRLILAGDRCIKNNDAEDNDFQHSLIESLQLFPEHTQLIIMSNMLEGLQKRNKNIDFLWHLPVFSAYRRHVLRNTIKSIDTKKPVLSPSLNRF